MQMDRQGESLIDTGQSGAMQSAAAVALMPLLIFFCYVHRSDRTYVYCSSDSQCFSISPQNYPLLLRNLGHYLIHGSGIPWALPSHPRKQHLDLFIHIAGLMNMTNRDTHTHRPRYCVCSNRHRSHVAAIAAMRPSCLIIILNTFIIVMRRILKVLISAM